MNAVRQVIGDQVQPRMATDGRRWPLLFFAVWALIHLEGAGPAEALSAVVGEI